MSPQTESGGAMAYYFAEYRLEPARRSLTRSDGSTLKVPGKLFDVLVQLVHHAGDVVDRSALLQAVWRKRVVEDNNVNQVIVGLRRILGAQHIVTVAGRGYQFVTPVRAVVLERVDEPAAPGREPVQTLHVRHEHGVVSDGRRPAVEGEPSSPASRPRFGWPGVAKLRYAVPALLALAAAVLGIDRYWPAPRNTTERIAVLPCDNLSPDPNDSYFAPGIHEELVNRLGQIQSLVVISRSSVLRYAEDRPPIRQIGADLGVDTIMECGVRYNGDQVMVTVQLLDAATDEQKWSRSYPGDMSDLHSVFAIQADIAIDVAHALRVQLFDEEREQIEQVSTESKEAYEFYLSAGTAHAARAIELLDRALELDPEFVEAWIRKAGRHMFIAGLKTGEESDADGAAAIEAANRALALDPYSPAAHAVLAAYLGQTGHWNASEEEWRRAFALGQDPADGAYFLLKMAVGHVADAVTAMEADLLKHPLNQGSRSFLLIAYEVLGDKQARRRHWERGEALFGTWMGDSTEPGLRLAENDRKFLQTEAPRGWPVWDAGVANLDSPDDGLAAMQSLHANPELRTAQTLRFMTAWALYFGDPAVALQWFRESVDLQATGMLNAWLPSYKELRREPGFKDLVRDQALPEYWNVYGWPEFCRPVEGDDFECD